jgi:hypothetical protein
LVVADADERAGCFDFVQQPGRNDIIND